MAFLSLLKMLLPSSLLFQVCGGYVHRDSTSLKLDERMEVESPSDLRRKAQMCDTQSIMKTIKKKKTLKK